MHDVTEGGVLGAIWEAAEASEVGVKIYKDKIPVDQVTVIISDYFNLDPLKLISSGCMLITCKDGEGLVKKLEENGVKATIIGTVTEDLKKLLIVNNNAEEIKQPASDELYKAVLT
jgi:hydrogenase maturation factor